jgi:uncharacterized protein DUF955
MLSFAVPFTLATMELIERRAEHVLAAIPGWIWNGARLPVPVETIVDSQYGLYVRDVDDLNAAPGAPKLDPGQSLSGLLLVARREIWLNADEARQWPGRRRFTLGHELGHWVLHRHGRSAVFCRAASLSAGERGDALDRLPAIEAEAHAFAAALLMPAEALRHAYEELDGDVHALCATFGSSRAAMVRRLNDVLAS